MKAAPAIRSKMGNTTYYMTRLTGRELANSVRPVRESEKWTTDSIDERIQRELDEKRVLRELVPYLAKHPDRFWGSIIVLAEANKLDFEPVTDIVDGIPRAYQDSVQSIGFLTQLGGELIALDGQHRLFATSATITSGDDLGPFQREVNDDEMSVIVIEFESAEKTRRIFSKVNRHAKPTGRSDNILLSEDDGFAIVSRMLLDPGRDAPLAKVHDDDGSAREIVNWKSTTLTRTMRHMTTISVVYDTVKHILINAGFSEDDWDEKKNPIRPRDEELETAYEIAARWWEDIIEHTDVLRDIRNGTLDIDDIRKIRFDNDDHRTLLLRPVGQIALVRGVTMAMANAQDIGKALTLTDALERANRLNWSAASSNYFRDTIVRANGRMSARAESYQLAAHLIAYLIGNEYLTDAQRRAVWHEWNRARGKLVENQQGRALSDAEIERALDSLELEEAATRQPESLPVPVV